MLPQNLAIASYKAQGQGTLLQLFSTNFKGQHSKLSALSECSSVEYTP